MMISGSEIDIRSGQCLSIAQVGNRGELNLNSIGWVA